MRPFGTKQVQSFIDEVRDIITAGGAVRTPDDGYDWQLLTKHGVLRLSFESYYPDNRNHKLLYIHCRFDNWCPVWCSSSGKWNHYACKETWQGVILNFRQEINDMIEVEK